MGCIFLEFITKFPVFCGDEEGDQLIEYFKVFGVNMNLVLGLVGKQKLIDEFSFLSDKFQSVKLVEFLEEFRSDYAEEDMIVFLDLCEKMLALDPKERISAREALNHEFFNGARKKFSTNQKSSSKKESVFSKKN